MGLFSRRTDEGASTAVAEEVPVAAAAVSSAPAAKKETPHEYLQRVANEGRVAFGEAIAQWAVANQGQVNPSASAREALTYLGNGGNDTRGVIYAAAAALTDSDPENPIPERVWQGFLIVETFMCNLRDEITDGQPPENWEDLCRGMRRWRRVLLEDMEKRRAIRAAHKRALPRPSLPSCK